MSESESKERKESFEESATPVEKRLGDLLMRGWIMMAESCSIECNKAH